jgi:uncharacterized protein YdiU (UPF0061 family)
MTLFQIPLKPNFSTELPADKITDNYVRKVFEACFSFVETQQPQNPKLIHVSQSFLDELGVEIGDLQQATKILSGAEKWNGFKSYAMCYGGHQFGHWAGQLGDGRAINIAEVDINNQNWKFQLKGSGKTPYSRGADGLAVLRSSIREYLCSEAMHHLGIPTTRALSLVKSGEMVTRDMLYNGNPKDETGAIVCRVSPSFIRFGNFEILAARKDVENLKPLADYTIKHHFSHLENKGELKYIEFFSEVAQLTRKMIVDWQRVGFVHGVMNTDNLSILGLTIDYGPYGWLEDYNPGWTPNTTDAQNKRYRFGNQPNIGGWNLMQLANALFPLVNEVEPFQKVLEEYRIQYFKDYHKMMCSKLGLYKWNEISGSFISKLTDNMIVSETDMTLFFRMISNSGFESFASFFEVVKKSSYLDENQIEGQINVWQNWFDEYIVYLEKEAIDLDERLTKMKLVNPKYVLRNWMAQLAIDDAEKGDYKFVDELYNLLQNPYDEQPNLGKWFAKRPEWAKHKVGCSMLSCSS